MATKASPRPVVAVVGTTGVGKSQLAVSLAQSLRDSDEYQNAVVLSADSMQLYCGLDVITNKVTEKEKGGVEHWGLDVVRPGHGGSWELGTWCTEAKKKMESLPHGTLPIICGGTHYFIQHFLFPPNELSLERPAEQQAARSSDPLATTWTPPGPCPPTPQDMPSALRILLDTFWMPNASFPAADDAPGTAKDTTPTSRPTLDSNHELLSLWKVLDSIDPREAQRWNWRDGRKVRRAIERWWERGGGAVVTQTERKDGPADGRRARFRTLLFWVYEPMETLRPRLDRRVDNMVSNGLLQEIEELRQIAVKLYGSAHPKNLHEGIFQAIGYKEFAELVLPQDNPEADPEFQAMLGRMKVSTHQYAKSQIKWIKKQMLPVIREAQALGGDVHLYVVPGGPDGEKIAKSVLETFLQRGTLPDPKSTGHADASSLTQLLSEDVKPVPDTAERQILNTRILCDTCSQPGSPYSVKKDEWHQHVNGRTHHRSKLLSMSTEQRQAWIEEQRRMGQAKRAARASSRERSGTAEAP